MNIVDNEKSMGLLKRNKMYESNKEHYVSTGRLTGSRSNEREKTILENLRVSDSNDLIYTFDISMDGNNIDKLKDLWGSIKSSCIYGSYKLHMVEYTDLPKFLSVSVKTKTENYVMSFLRSTCKTEEFQFNRTCQKMMIFSLLCMDTSVSVAKSNLRSSYWYNVHKFLGSTNFMSILDTLPAQMKEKLFLTILTFHSLSISKLL